MTREQLKECCTARKELLLIKHQLKAGGEDTIQTSRLKKRAERMEVNLGSIEDYIDSLGSSILRQIVTLRYIEDMSIKDTAAFMGYSESRIKGYLTELFRDSQNEI